MNQRDLTYARWTAVVGVSFALLAAVLQYWPSSNELGWLSIDEAKPVASKQRKPIFMDVYAPWCGPCKNMDKMVFSEDSVQRALQSRYILAKINGDDPVQGDTLRKQWGIKAYPTYIILNPMGRERKRHVGFFPKTEFLQWINDSSGIQILQWLEVDKAVEMAAHQKRRVMVLVLQSGEEVETADGLFEDPQAREVIDQHFNPTLLVRSNPSDRKALEQVGSTSKEGLGEVIVLESDRREVGRFRLEPQMEFSSLAVVNKLKELATK